MVLTLTEGRSTMHSTLAKRVCGSKEERYYIHMNTHFTSYVYNVMYNVSDNVYCMYMHTQYLSEKVFLGCR